MRDRSASQHPASPTLTKKDFQSGQDVRWCPGCGDYAILNGLQSTFAKLGIPRENFVVVSGIGCSSRFPYYMSTFGFHGIHGRAPAIASGLKIARPDLSVWVVTGDGDALSIGGNHFIHVLRRNVGVKILLFDNKIYGLTKGQFSPTSERGKRTISSPLGSVEVPFNPISMALAAGATFVARTVDIYGAHLQTTLERAARHRGAAFVQIYQNCNIFNNKAWAPMTDKAHRDDRQVLLQHERPLIFGKDANRGIRRAADGALEAVTIGQEADESDLLRHDEHRENPALAFELSRLAPPDLPTPIGIFRDVEALPFEEGIAAQIDEARRTKPAADLRRLLHGGQTWEIR